MYTASRLFMEDVDINSAGTKLMCLVTSNVGVKIIHRRHRYQQFTETESMQPNYR